MYRLLAGVMILVCVLTCTNSRADSSRPVDYYEITYERVTHRANGWEVDNSVARIKYEDADTGDDVIYYGHFEVRVVYKEGE